jgi:hypothetical protein
VFSCYFHVQSLLNFFFVLEVSIPSYCYLLICFQMWLSLILFCLFIAFGFSFCTP